MQFKEPDIDYDTRNKVLISNDLNKNDIFVYRVRRHVDGLLVCMKTIAIKSDQNEETYDENYRLY